MVDVFRTFFDELRERAIAHGGYLAVVEICGFNPWLLTLLPEHGCRETIVVLPGEQSSHKTDRRDASGLSEVPWINRNRIKAVLRRHNLEQECPNNVERDKQLDISTGKAGENRAGEFGLDVPQVPQPAHDLVWSP